MILIDFLKTGFALLAIGLGYYFGSSMGFGIWSVLCMLAGVLSLLAVFIPVLHELARLAAILTGMVSTLVVVVVLVLGGVGGHYHLKEQAQLEVYFLVLLMLFGFSAFKWKLKKQ